MLRIQIHKKGLHGGDGDRSPTPEVLLRYQLPTLVVQLPIKIDFLASYIIQTTPQR